MADAENLRYRALHAYYGRGPSGVISLATPTARLAEHDGRSYMVVEGDRTLAVYRVRNSGMLKYLRRPPREIAPDWYGGAS